MTSTASCALIRCSYQVDHQSRASDQVFWAECLGQHLLHRLHSLGGQQLETGPARRDLGRCSPQFFPLDVHRMRSLSAPDSEGNRIHTPGSQSGYAAPAGSQVGNCSANVLVDGVRSGKDAHRQELEQTSHGTPPIWRGQSVNKTKLIKAAT